MVYDNTEMSNKISNSSIMVSKSKFKFRPDDYTFKYLLWVYFLPKSINQTEKSLSLIMITHRISQKSSVFTVEECNQINVFCWYIYFQKSINRTENSLSYSSVPV